MCWSICASTIIRSRSPSCAACLISAISILAAAPDADKLKIAGAVLADLKRIMAAKGFYRGDASSPWDEATFKALDAFVASENFEERVDLNKRTIDAPVMAYLRGQA